MSSAHFYFYIEKESKLNEHATRLLIIMLGHLAHHQNEQAGHPPGLQMQMAIARVQSAQHSTVIDDNFIAIPHRKAR